MSRLYVGELPSDVSSADLASLIGKVCKVFDVYIPPQSVTGIERRFGIVNIETDETAIKKCLKVFDNSLWRGSRIRLQIAKEFYKDRLKREQFQNDFDNLVENKTSKGENTSAEVDVDTPMDNAESEVARTQEEGAPSSIRIKIRQGAYLNISTVPQPPSLSPRQSKLRPLTVTPQVKSEAKEAKRKDKGKSQVIVTPEEGIVIPCGIKILFDEDGNAPPLYSITDGFMAVANGHQTTDAVDCCIENKVNNNKGTKSSKKGSRVGFGVIEGVTDAQGNLSESVQISMEDNSHSSRRILENKVVEMDTLDGTCAVTGKAISLVDVGDNGAIAMEAEKQRALSILQSLVATSATAVAPRVMPTNKTKTNNKPDTLVSGPASSKAQSVFPIGTDLPSTDEIADSGILTGSDDRRKAHQSNARPLAQPALPTDSIPNHKLPPVSEVDSADKPFSFSFFSGEGAGGSAKPQEGAEGGVGRGAQVDTTAFRNIFHQEGGMMWGGDGSLKQAVKVGTEALITDRLFLEAEKLGIDARPRPEEDNDGSTTERKLLFGFFNNEEGTKLSSSRHGSATRSNSIPHRVEDYTNLQSEVLETPRLLTIEEVHRLAQAFSRSQSIEEVTKQWKVNRDKLIIDYKRKRKEGKKYDDRSGRKGSARSNSSKSVGHDAKRSRF